MLPDAIPTNADIIPLEIAIVLLLELLFGIGYNVLVAYWMKHQMMHVSWTVVIGVTGTLLFPSIIWFDATLAFWQMGVLLGLCFAASGIPMIVGSQNRTVKEKDSKKRRPWPTAALRVRDDVVMELSAMAHEIAEKAKQSKLSVQDLPDYVNRLHGVIGTLKSV
jgi:hypothetical protein